MLDLLGEREHSAAELQKILAVPKANLSQHLAILKAVGIVRTRREGRHIFCALAIPAVKRACGMIQEVLRARFQNKQSLKF
jgi:DNA-binding transcriptional ArsR family regulator